MYRKVDIRPYRPEDEPVLFGLARLGRGADERTLAVLEQETVFVAEVEGSAAGYAACEVRGSIVRVDQLFISDDHEAEGVGQQLLDYVEGYAISKGAETLQIVVEAENRRALDFYRRRGFVRAGEDLVELILPRG